MKDIGRLCLGAASGHGNAGCLTWSARNRHAWPLEPRVRSIEDNLIEVLDTRSGDVHARAAFGGMRSSGFWLDWLVADGDRRELAYVRWLRGTPGGLRALRRARQGDASGG